MRNALFLIGSFAAILPAQPYLSTLPADHPSTQNSIENWRDPAGLLGRDLAFGRVTLESRPGSGYLASLLEHLGIPVDSQMLVFSKTSLQAGKISPRNPRAIYFNDDVAVGWVRGGEGIEIASQDPRQGVSFYRLMDNDKGIPTMTNHTDCLHCHHGASTMGVPGMFVGSVFPDSSGAPARVAAIITDHRTPFKDRWGGWYVNALRGEQPDRANSVALDPAEPLVLATAGRQNLRSLAREFPSDGYLSAVSDIVALMTFEHQSQMANLFTRLNWESRLGMPLEADLNLTVDYMLFVDEAPLKEPIEGVSTFTKTFPERGPHDRQGRSLRDFDLKTRLFRHPLSYMIYSASFDALPDSVRAAIYQRLYERLKGSPIIAILRETKPGLPEYWR